MFTFYVLIFHVTF